MLFIFIWLFFLNLFIDQLHANFEICNSNDKKTLSYQPRATHAQNNVTRRQPFEVDQRFVKDNSLENLRNRTKQIWSTS